MTIESEFFTSVLDNFYDGVYFVDANRMITYWNKSAERISGYSREEAVGSRCFDNMLQHIDSRGCQLCHGECPVAATLATGEKHEAEVYLHHRDGHRVPVQVRVAPIHDPDGAVIGAIEIFSDNTARMAALQRADELEDMAFSDPLTGLANRRLTEISIRTRLDELKRYDWPFGLLFIDIDRFKEINDRHGHEIGDGVLRVVAASLRAAARSFDLVGRWGGEEFLALIVNIDEERLHAIAERFRMLVASSDIPNQAELLHVTVSIGGCLARRGDSIEALVSRADALMYASKQAGRDCVTIASADGAEGRGSQVPSSRLRVED